MDLYDRHCLGVGITGSIFLIIIIVILFGNINITDKYQKEIILLINQIRSNCSNNLNDLKHTKFAQNTSNYYAYSNTNLDNALNILKYTTQNASSIEEAYSMAIEYWSSESLNNNTINNLTAINWKNATDIGVTIITGNSYTIYVAILSPDNNVNLISDRNENIICA